MFFSGLLTYINRPHGVFKNKCSSVTLWTRVATKTLCPHSVFIPPVGFQERSFTFRWRVSWSPFQLTLGERRDPANRTAHVDIHTFTFSVLTEPLVYIWGLWEEAGVVRGNQCKHGGDCATSTQESRTRDSNPNPPNCEADVLNTFPKVLPYILTPSFLTRRLLCLVQVCAISLYFPLTDRFKIVYTGYWYKL